MLDMNKVNDIPMVWGIQLILVEVYPCLTQDFPSKNAETTKPDCCNTRRFPHLQLKLVTVSSLPGGIPPP